MCSALLLPVRLRSTLPPVVCYLPSIVMCACMIWLVRVYIRLAVSRSDATPGITHRITPRCRYEHFFHFALAHLTLYGLVKDFWAVWARLPETHRGGSKSSANRLRKPRLASIKYILPRYIKKEIAARATQIQWTSQVKKRSADVLGYAP